ncbi:MAG: hypothetical protein KC656_03490 [Myxococcales bacterium]|nr:hypothetical protein [Myxococcales bacterium]MCB9672308.1 hypothetical protein [Alphaproteobacteria bacterium]MCB9692692.1 hypothetical protein [Alphaproteobacteria bacterium]
MATVLQLPPEQGGLVFGPFEGIVQLGSDPRRSQIQLDSRHGIYPLHATLALTASGPHQFAPAELGAKCFLAQAGSQQVWPVNGAVQVKPGDSIILGTPGGPRFTLVEQAISVRGPVAGAGAAMAAGAAGGGLLAVLDGIFQPRHRRRNQGLGQGIADEVARRAQAELFRQGPLRELSYMYRRARMGALFSPYAIVGGMITLFSMIGAGSVTCFGGLLALWSRLF